MPLSKQAKKAGKGARGAIRKRSKKGKATISKKLKKMI